MKFKKGDRVIAVSGHQKGNIFTVEEYAVDGEKGWFSTEEMGNVHMERYYELESVYNSPLWKVINEKDNNENAN